MTKQGEVIEAKVKGHYVEYTAEYPDGRQIIGRIHQDYQLGHTLSEDALYQVVEEIVGSSVDPFPD